jgi:hypothetical protein
VGWPIHKVETSQELVSVRETGPAYETFPETDIPIVPTEEVLGPDDSRYAPLAIWLQSRLSSEDRVQLAFVEVEEIIGGPLPASARTHRAWWANDPVGHVQSQQWLDVGWRVAPINMTEEKVTFARIRERKLQQACQKRDRNICTSSLLLLVVSASESSCTLIPRIRRKTNLFSIASMQTRTDFMRH